MLTKYERETQINFNEEEDIATVYTHNNKLKKRLAQFSEKSSECSLIKSNEEYEKYMIPKSWVKIHMPKNFSEEYKAKLAERARENLARWKEKQNG